MYIGGLTAEITEEDLRDKFYLFGEIKGIRMVQKSLCAFVTFTSRAAAEKAVEVTHHALNIKGKNLKVAWGKPQTFDPSAQTRTCIFCSKQENLPETGDGGYVGVAATYAGGGLAASAAPNLLAPPPGLAPAAQVPYYPSMDPNLMGSRPSFKPINLAPES